MWQTVKHLVPRVALAAPVVLSLAASPADAETPQCWPQGALAHHQGDERIQKNVPAAIVAAPQGQSEPRAASGIPGAVRRVELPPGSKKLIAITFDLCEQHSEITGYQGDIVDFLRAENVKATFFAGGKWLLTHRDRGQQLMSDPLFEVGSHSWEHRNLRVVSEAGLEQEIDAPQLAYRKLRSELAVKHCARPGVNGLASERAPEGISLFRFPYGACDARSLQAVAGHGLTAIQWDVSAGDPWIGATSPLMIQSVLAHVRPGSIVIFHANGRGVHTSEALPQIIAQLKRRGYEFVTVSELLRAGKPVVEARCYDAKPGDTDRYDAAGRRLEERYAGRVAARPARGGELNNRPRSGWAAFPE